MRRLRHNFGRTVTSPAKRREQPLIVKRGSGLGALVILMLSALVWSSLQVTDAGATHINRVGVVSLLGDTFHAEHTGLTAFNQRSYDVEVPEWQIDQDVTEYLVAKLTSANLSAGSVNIEPNRVKDFYRLWPLQQKRRMDSSKFNQLFTLASAQGYDTLVVMIPTFEPELKMPVAKARSCCGKQRAMVLMHAGKLTASPTPRQKRMITNHATVVVRIEPAATKCADAAAKNGTSAWAAAAIDQTITPITNPRRIPI